MSQFDQAVFSKALIAIRTRAERLDGDQIVDSFSSVGPLADLISSHDHQVIYGRRGTGKTHALRFLYARVNQEGDIGIFVDMLKLGSNTSIYNDQSLTIPERATRLLIDTLAHIQEGFLDYATSGVAIDFQSFGKLLDGFNEATSQVRVSGEVTRTTERPSSRAGHARPRRSSVRQARIFWADLASAARRTARAPRGSLRSSKGASSTPSASRSSGPSCETSLSSSPRRVSGSS